MEPRSTSNSAARGCGREADLFQNPDRFTALSGEAAHSAWSLSLFIGLRGLSVVLVQRSGSKRNQEEVCMLEKESEVLGIELDIEELEAKITPDGDNIIWGT
jgi:hypothetical protein